MAQITEWRGIENLVYAEVTKDDADAYETGEVKKLAGIATISKTTNNSTETHFYDNTPAVNIVSVGADEVTLTISALDLEVLAAITGQKYDADLGAIIEGERVSKYYAIGYKAKKTTGEEIYVWRYKGTFSIPDATHETETDGTEANGDEIVFTGISTTHSFNKIGARARAMQIGSFNTKADLSTFFDEVTTPDMLTVTGA